MTESYKPAEDLNHNFISADHQYGCFDEDRTARPILVQTGWTSDGRRVMAEHTTIWQARDCTHSYSSTDPSCTGCKWRES